MIAKRLESLLATEAAKTAVCYRSSADLVQRFQSLRGFGLLPKGRGKNAQHLSHVEIVAGVLSIATPHPGYAGLVAKMLMGLRPVGGVGASFRNAETFGKALVSIFGNPNALDSFIEVRVSESEIYTNGHGRASIEYRSGDATQTSFYVGQTAGSLLQLGAEKTYNSRDLISAIIVETVFYPSFFRRLIREIEREPKMLSASIDNDLEEDDEELRKEERVRRLGILPGSRFLNLAVDNQVTWPSKETAVEFEGRKLVLMPKTKENTTSIHIDLHGQRISSEDATTLINRFLSILSWCDDHFAILQEGWSGNPVPVPVPRRNLAFSTAHHWVFDRKIPNAPEAKKALAIYREARNAHENCLISYAILAYYKIIEVKYKEKDKALKWFAQNYLIIKKNPNLAEGMARFENDLRGQAPAEYLWVACRSAVAHAKNPYNSTDPDDMDELRRLHCAADILRALARLFIKNELGVSDCMFDGT